jgi:hypothetical protein
MKTAVTALLLVLAFAATPAFARKSCDELKQEIAAKLDAKGVKNYTLDVVAHDAQDARKTVGTCDGGAQRLVYERGAKAAQAAPAAN